MMLFRTSICRASTFRDTLKSRSMRRHLVSAVCFVLVVAALSAGARAADDPQKAKALFEQGKTFFDLGQFDKAIQAWQDGYTAKADPGFLYNIGQAYRLSGDPQKAIFFYKRFLGYSPKAPNRAEIEQKIAALQKQISEGKPPAPPPPGGTHPDTATTTTTTTPPPPPGPGPGPGNGTTVATTGTTNTGTTTSTTTTAPAYPPPYPPPPGFGVASSTGSSTPPPFVPGPPPPSAGPPPGLSVAPRDQMDHNRPIDIGAAVGSDFWASGLPGSAQPSFAFTLAAGYTFAGASDGALKFRLGAMFGYTFLQETMSNDTFVSLLVVPSLRIRLGASRLSLQADLGVGALSIGGLKPTSELLSKQQALKINGAQGMLELRPALSLEYRVARSLGVFLGPAIAYSPKQAHFYAPISRVELLLGVAYRL
jgi:hypothetical protein